ncbi:helicase nuclease [Pithovirus sibericum]|uniref:Helicase nuclease n=1 Tax=Pithovirus sibericum TaxID=1450746 RepID=W5S5L2_9VIRU|nr:helicase nuclease [Pithovirus sibericum]AHH02016.1 helicase nuclease [Pithovirus sibericum]
MSPIVCILFILVAIAILWLIYGGKEQEFVGISLEDTKFLSSIGASIVDKKPSTQSVDKEEVTISLPTESPRPTPRNLSYPPIEDCEPLQPGKRSKGEQICCDTLEKIYSKPFYRVRPGFLRNPETGRKLEIDCFNKDLRIGVEYNGRQHYVWPNFTGQSKQEFLNQVRRDRFKIETCDRNGVYLITVPYTVSHDQIPLYIQQRLP